MMTSSRKETAQKVAGLIYPGKDLLGTVVYVSAIFIGININTNINITIIAFLGVF